MEESKNVPPDKIEYPPAEKHEYYPVFSAADAGPGTRRYWKDGYFESSKALVQGIVSGEEWAEVAGVPALFLFRHYLELALKFIAYHARWLEDEATNAIPEEAEAIRRTHSLRALWQTVEGECRAKISDSV
jgi:hypothetical protein